MAGQPGNQAFLEIGRQTAKDTAAATVAFKVPFTGGNIQPDRPTDRLNETDSSRDQGTAFVQSYGAAGTPEFYARDDSIVAALHAVLGGLSSSAGPTNFVHTVTPANTVPYMTLWRMIAGPLYEQFKNVVVNSVTIKGEAGQPLTVSMDVQGTLATQLSADPGVAVQLSSSVPYFYMELAVTLGGGADRRLKSFEVTINNNITKQATDDYEPYDIVPGRREVSVSFEYIYENLTEYNKFHYGGASPALPATQNSTLYETQATFTITKSANNEIKLDIPHLIYEEFPIEPDPGGEPIVVSARGSAQRNVTDPVLTATVKNQSAGTVYAGT